MLFRYFISSIYKYFNFSIFPSFFFLAIFMCLCIKNMLRLIIFCRSLNIAACFSRFLLFSQLLGRILHYSAVCRSNKPLSHKEMISFFISSPSDFALDFAFQIIYRLWKHSWICPVYNRNETCKIVSI